MSEAYVGRQAIYDRALNVYAYELLYRASGEAQHAGVVDGDAATMNVLVSSFCDLGLEHLAGDALCFINMTSRFIKGDLPLPLPPDRIVLEMLEDIEPSPEIVEGLRRLKEQGAQIALDDYIHRPGNEELLELADYVKIDLRAQSHEETAQLVETLRPYGMKLLAEKVETREELHYCESLGFDFFQGYFLTKPEIMKGFKIPSNKVNHLKLLTRIVDPDVDMEELGEMISVDAAMSYRLLRFANSALYAPEQPISAIGQMIMMLGLRTVRKVVSLMVMMDLDDSPGDLLACSLVRAKMCECLAELAGGRGSSAFYTVGLLSTLDAITGAQMEEVMKHVPLADEIQAALLTGEGDMGAALECVRAFEVGDWNEATYKDLSPETLSKAYIQAVEHSREIWGALPKQEVEGEAA